MTDLARGTRVVLTQGLRGVPCAPKGKYGTVSRPGDDDGTYLVVMDCGHPLHLPAGILEPTPYHRCVNCRALKKLKDLRTPSFWRSGLLCRGCWKELNIGHHQRVFKKAQSKKKGAAKKSKATPVRLPARKRRKSRKKK